MRISDAAGIDSKVRGAIQSAALAPNKDTESLYQVGENDPCFFFDEGCSRLAAGKVLSAVGPFVYGIPHLHFSILDACENFDGLSPLGVYKAQGFDIDYEDNVDPKVESLDLADDMYQTISVTDRCHDVAEPFNIVAKMYDTWRVNDGPEDDDYLLRYNDRLGVYESTYRLVNLSEQENGEPVTWYKFDQVPFKCAGENQGEACLPDLDEDDFCAELNIHPVIEANKWFGPYLAYLHARYMFCDTGSYNSESLDFNQGIAAFYHTLNHKWGANTAPLAPAEGQYQLTAEAFDFNGRTDQRTIFFKVPADPAMPTGDLVIRDHEFDLGAVPSTLGGNKFYKSTSIRVIPDLIDDEDNPCPAPGHADWDTTQWYSVLANDDYKVCVRVENMGCDAIANFDVQVGETYASMISTNWQIIDAEKTVPGTINNPAIEAFDDMSDTDARVVSFDWTPTTTGHRCLIAGVTSTDNPIKEIEEVMGVMDFTALDGPDSEFVPWDSNLGQRNVTVSYKPFKFGNPFSTAINLSVDFDCNDLPIDDINSSVILRMDTLSAVEDNWNGVEGTSWIAGIKGKIQFSLDQCTIHFPEIEIPANSEVDAWLDITLPAAYTGTWVVDLTASIDGVARDGIAIAHSQ